MRYGSAGTVKGDPYWTTCKYPCDCAGCSVAIRKGDRIFYWPKGKRVECVFCGSLSYKRFIAECEDEILSGGW